ncbi:MAG: N-acetyl-1-D-myo-inositol-2-amino-2-deoxy-alpha-D-glucopyranoside deacetylase [Actinomycetales bacterium]
MPASAQAASSPPAAPAGRRMLLVHAHPDDESLTTGATMAAAAADGAHVTLVTCTRGELGEVVADDLAHLRGDPEALAAHRETELAAAAAALGVTDHRFLGADAGVRYRDTGMVSLPGGLAAIPDDVAPGAFAVADLDEAAGHLARVLREVRPHLLLTYDRTGGYGHPDHVMAHRVALRAVDLAAGPARAGADEVAGWRVPKVYAAVWPLGVVRAALRALADAGRPVLDPDGPLPGMVVPDDQVTAVVDAPEHWASKAAALQAHRSQLRVDLDAGTTTQDDGMAVPIVATEGYQLLRGTSAPPFDTDGRETDLFAGTGA